MRDILIIGLIIAVIVILIRVAMGTPMLKRVMESFTGGAASASITECPAGSKFYIHDDVVLCCSGRINKDANSLKESCMPLRSTRDDLNFCTLGADQPDIPNCMNTKEKKYKEKAARVCPPSSPNYVEGPAYSDSENGKCCVGPTNAERTECMSDEGSCLVAAPGINIMKTPKASCQLKKLIQTDGACPSTYTSGMVENYASSGFNLPYCIRATDNKFCIPKPLINKGLETKYMDYPEQLRKNGGPGVPKDEHGFLEFVKQFSDRIPQC
jgi:hypothetical protein